ncbi:MAG: NAD-dependent deacylase [Pseudomonadota bacterium]
MKYQSILILTGSGISAESGVATFRDPDGVWAKYDYREVATPEGYAANPALVHEFYNARRKGLVSVEPNPAHNALANLEMTMGRRGGTITLVTQNVDNLHERAGSKSVIHMHGELTKVTCISCGAVAHCDEEISVETKCEACGEIGTMRPDIVWFGEMPKFLDEIGAALLSADVFVSIGTSGSVYPAAGYVFEAEARGIPCVELNLEPSENAASFSEARYGKASEIVPQWVSEVLGDQ